MKNGIYFISDVHLALEKPQITRKLLNFLQQVTTAQAVYILGDLFDVWVGDDDFSPPIKKIKQALRQLTENGTAIFLQPGNRDFLIGKQFCSETGVVLLDDYAVIELNGIKTLLTHGDLLCTDDLAYQAFRLKSHTPEWQMNVLSKPLILRLLVARWYRLRSFFHKRKQAQEIMDVNQNTVIEIMQQYQVQCLIHGHTHRSAIHDLFVNQQAAQRIVLSEWRNETASALYWEGKDGLRFVDI